MWLRLPDEPVTVMLNVPAGVPLCAPDDELPPPQANDSTASSSTALIPIQARRRKPNRRRLGAPMNTQANAGMQASALHNLESGGKVRRIMPAEDEERAVVVTVTVAVLGFALSMVTELGATEQVEAAGAPLQASPTAGNEN